MEGAVSHSPRYIAPARTSQKASLSLFCVFSLPGKRVHTAVVLSPVNMQLIGYYRPICRSYLEGSKVTCSLRFGSFCTWKVQEPG
jgi:hypothetical protein